ncbi:hypothetical protein F7731_17110 [Cytobacillus depressus]|uniref:Zinc chelation protein SecC n=2 Tax=Cytobacillus depressus TaxID=1602942 RepID=A0A6L3V2F0_9BACI|nr:hypothetical protein F7731_17110 [Cytobacillus depressus]
MLNILAELKDMKKKAKVKTDNRFWKELTIPVALNDSLNSLTMDELHAIRKHLNIKKASGLKKAGLIDLFQEKIPALLENVIMTFDKEQWELIQKIIKNGGHLKAPNLEEYQIKHFRACGFIFTGTVSGEKVLVIPTDLIEPLSSLKDSSKVKSIVTRNSEWIKLTHGLLYYYGTLSVPELIELLEKYTTDPFDSLEYLSIINQASTFYHEVRIDGHGFSNVRVFDPEKVKKEHSNRKSLDYYPFTKDQLLKAGEPGYVERNDSYQQFVSFLVQNYNINRNDADSIVEECVFAIKLGESPNDILKYLQSILEIDNLDTLQGFMGKVVHLMNNTREWFLKGYSPVELSQDINKGILPLATSNDNVIDFNSQRKVGRNDPCPCGSGKKFKKCCGR